MRSLQQEIVHHLGEAKVGEIVRDGLRVVIAGPPNAGKSSLMNYLARRDVAIVTEVAGTTRDVLHVDLDLLGFAVRLFDTAGLRETEDVVEQEGIRRTQLSMADAHLVLLLSDRVDEDWAMLAGAYEGPVVRVLTKSDMQDSTWPSGLSDVMISTRTGSGIDDLLKIVAGYLPDIEAGSALALPTRRRHMENLAEARTQIERAIFAGDDELDIQAEYLRLAGQALGRVTGRVDVENLLDVIFSEFCIGK
jgi:tRNA modification GTPase